MKIASNVTEKKLSTVFSKFAVEKALMLEFNIAYIANWYFGSDYVNCTNEKYALQKGIQIVLRKMKTAYCAIFKLQ